MLATLVCTEGLGVRNAGGRGVRRQQIAVQSSLDLALPAPYHSAREAAVSQPALMTAYLADFAPAT